MWMPALMKQRDRGALVPSSSSGFIAASHCFIPYTVDAASVEAYVLRDGLLSAQQIVMVRVEIQSDCMEVVNTMQDGDFSATAATTIYDECAQGRNLRQSGLVTVIELLIQWPMN